MKTLNAFHHALVIGSISLGDGMRMVNEGKGRLFRRKDGKYLVYLPKDLAEDSMFPFKEAASILVKVSFKIGENKLSVEKMAEDAPITT